MTMNKSTSLEQELKLIKERNNKVETDKSWETSLTRRLVIAISTYIIAGIWLVLINDTYPWLKAFVPAGGYLLSTLSLSFFKNLWLKYFYK